MASLALQSMDYFIKEGEEAYKAGDFRKGAMIFVKALRSYKDVDNTEAQAAIAMYHLAHFYIEQKQFKKAESLLEKSCTLLTRINVSKKSVSMVVEKLADVNTMQSHFKEASQLYKRCIDLNLSGTDEDRDLSRRYLKLSDALFQLGQNEQALNYVNLGITACSYK
jgi:tetratricopeptide (TPR) repeat protein